MGSNYTLGRQSNKINTYVDIVFVIDTTGSMGPFLNTVKGKALNLYGDVMKKMESKGKHITRLRGRIVAYRDYLSDGKDAMLVTDFFDLNTQAAEFAGCINMLEPNGGGDDLEDGLEAVAFAIGSDWTRARGRNRQIVAVWSDAGCHEIGYGKKAANYPSTMAKSYSELASWWGSIQSSGKYMDMHARRLLLFTPGNDWWDKLEKWPNALRTPIDIAGFNNSDYDMMLETIGNSI